MLQSQRLCVPGCCRSVSSPGGAGRSLPLLQPTALCHGWQAGRLTAHLAAAEIDLAAATTAAVSQEAGTPLGGIEVDGRSPHRQVSPDATQPGPEELPCEYSRGVCVPTSAPPLHDLHRLLSADGRDSEPKRFQHAGLTAADRTLFQSYTLHIIFKQNDTRQHTNRNKLKSAKDTSACKSSSSSSLLLSSGQKTLIL